jgi:hypothetical protein
MFHNHAISRRIYITADKWSLNMFLHVHTHTSDVRLVAPAKWNSGWLQHARLEFFKRYWLPEFPPSSGQLKWQVSLYVPVLPMQAHAGHGTLRTGFWPLNTIFWSWQRVVGDGWLQSLHHVRNTKPRAMRLCHSAMWNLAEMTLEINLCELTAPFEHCILETTN